jgi:hypothetical protein
MHKAICSFQPITAEGDAMTSPEREQWIEVQREQIKHNFGETVAGDGGKGGNNE